MLPAAPFDEGDENSRGDEGVDRGCRLGGSNTLPLATSGLVRTQLVCDAGCRLLVGRFRRRRGFVRLCSSGSLASCLSLTSCLSLAHKHLARLLRPAIRREEELGIGSENKVALLHFD